MGVYLRWLSVEHNRKQQPAFGEKQIRKTTGRFLLVVSHISSRPIYHFKTSTTTTTHICLEKHHHHFVRCKAVVNGPMIDKIDMNTICCTDTQSQLIIDES
jgi:hypothetical protein